MKLKDIELKIGIFLLTFTLVIGTFCLPTYAFSTEKDISPRSKIIYIPLDDRPVNLSYVLATFAHLPVKLVVPPEKYLSQRIQETDTMGELWQWLLDQCPSADIAVLSADTLVYGGLIPSRLHQLERETLEKRVEALTQLKRINPRLKIYVFSTIMRSAKMSKAGLEPDYYSTCGPEIFHLTALQDKKERIGLHSNEETALQEIEKSLPSDLLKDWLGRRKKNFAVNEKLIQLTKQHLVDYLILCRDDTSTYSQSSQEYRLLAKEVSSLTKNPLPFLRRFHSFCGADETGLILLTRALRQYNSIKVYPIFTPGAGAKTIPNYEDQTVGQNIENHLSAIGAVAVKKPEDADLILAVNTPVNGITHEANSELNNLEVNAELEQFINNLGEYLNSGKKVALADVAFTNGADNALMAQLAEKKLLSKLQAYAGWNTAGNSIGYALGQGLLADGMNVEQKNSLLQTRLLDDWAYQANVREKIVEELLKTKEINPDALDEEELIADKVEKDLQAFQVKYFSDFPIGTVEVHFPWQRLFEVEVELTNQDSFSENRIENKFLSEIEYKKEKKR